VDVLRGRLAGLDGQDYAAYQSLRGEHDFGTHTLVVDQVPKDPYAPPDTGVYRVRVARVASGLDLEDDATAVGAVATRDYVARRFHAAAGAVSGKRRGTGNSGIITIAQPGQVVLDRTSVALDAEWLEVRCFVGLPAQGRTIDSALAETMLFDELPEIVRCSLLANTLDRDALVAHRHTVEDARALRAQLRPSGLVAFLADGAVLPRASGVDSRPLTGPGVVPFESPDRLRVTLDTPHAGPISGMGIPEGVTLVVGGGYHGKSTMLAAVAEGVYDHIPRDGRERCVTVVDAISVKAAPGRAVTATDIGGFIRRLPDGRDSARFTTGNASGSTSQAASVAEAIEAGARLLLMDEDSSATNFLVRDARMQRLVPPEEEPITVFLDRVRQLCSDLGVSTILVLGGSGDYFDAADHILQLVTYRGRDVTDTAKRIAAQVPTGRTSEALTGLLAPVSRAPLPVGIDPTNQYGHHSVRAPAAQRLVFGDEEIDLTDVSQLAEPAQTLAIGLAVERIAGEFDGQRSLRETIDHVVAEVEEYGLDVLDPNQRGGLAGFRGLELAATVNRIRSLHIGGGDAPVSPYEPPEPLPVGQD